MKIGMAVHGWADLARLVAQREMCWRREQDRSVGQRPLNPALSDLMRKVAEGASREQ